ncbi:MAG: 4-hydroxythreonine-4-phosphate dehydrogenase PdxA [Bacteroidota bacterium]
MSKVRVGISIGDTNGIGPEIIVKSFTHEGMGRLMVPIVYGERALLKQLAEGKNLPLPVKRIENAEQAQEGRLNVIDCWEESIDYQAGQATSASGLAAVLSLEKATEDLKNGQIDALVTAPINKANMPRDRFPFPGHTEFLTKRLDAKESLMFMVSGDLRVGLVTNHLPVAEVAKAITKARILDKLTIMDNSLRRDFGLEKPTIAVLGLNPHAGDDGLLGQEEKKIIRPAVEEAKKRGIMAMGPFPADGFFGSGRQQKFDAVLAMYHDQGLVPFKALSFGKGVNFTAGLPAIRTSPDHGTAYDIAGQNQADPASFKQALFLAVEAVPNRRRYDEDTKNPLVIQVRKPKRKSRKEGEQKGGKKPA